MKALNSDMQIRHPGNSKEISAVLDMLCSCFPRISRAYFSKKIFSGPNYNKNLTYLLIKGGFFISHARLFKKNIYCGTATIPITGLGEICTLPKYRKRGYGTKLLERIIQDSGRKRLARIIILFTRNPRLYEKLKFSKVAQKWCLLKRKGEKNRESLNLDGFKIRRFNPAKDLLSIKKLYDDFFGFHFGPVVRSLNYWRFQLSYFNEDKKLFLVLEDKHAIKSYIRCKKFKKGRQDIIEVVEFASSGRNARFLIILLEHLFKLAGRNCLGIDRQFVKNDFYAALPGGNPSGIGGWLRRNFEVKTEDNFLLMYKLIGKNKKLDSLMKKEMVFLESDAF